jgi:hypothetical protein
MNSGGGLVSADGTGLAQLRRRGTQFTSIIDPEVIKTCIEAFMLKGSSVLAQQAAWLAP